MTNERTQAELKVKKVTLFEVKWSDFEEFVQKVYNQNYDFVVDQECRNDSSHSFEDITGKLGEYDEEDLKKFVETGEYSNSAHIILEDLCRNKHIQPGNYLISVCW